MHRIVGLDLTADSLRLVALESGFRGFTVQGARTVRLPDGGTWPERLRAALTELGPAAPGPTDVVAVALPGSQVAAHHFSLPFADPGRIQQVLPAEIEGVVPFDLDEVVWDSAILSRGPKGSQVLVAVARKEVVREQLAALSEAGIDPRLLTFGPLALAGLSERGLLAAAEPGETVALLSAGPGEAELAVVEATEVRLARALTSPDRVAWERAAQEPAAADRLLSGLGRELKLTLRAKGHKPNRLLLGGPLSTLPGASEALAAALGLPVSKLALAAPAHELPAGEMARAYGLALRAQQPRGKINFRKGEFAPTQRLPQHRGMLMRYTTLAASIVALLLLWGTAEVIAVSHREQVVDDAICAMTQRTLGHCTLDLKQAVASLSGGSSKAASIPRVSAAQVLAELSEGIPEAAMPRMDEVEVATDTVRLKGTAESFAAADQIKLSLKKDRCFGEVKQPRVEKQRDGSKVSFQLDFPYLCANPGASKGA